MAKVWFLIAWDLITQGSVRLRGRALNYNFKERFKMANRHIALIVGQSKGGKSTSLHGLQNQEGVMYLNCEADKEIPFPNCGFQAGPDGKPGFTVTDPYQIVEAFQHLKNNPGMAHTVVIDTLTMLMEMFYSKYIHNSTNGMKAWAEYAEFFRKLMQEHVASSDVNVLFLAHVEKKLNEEAMVMETKVPVQGQLAKKGIEAYFTTIVSAKRVSLTTLEPYKNDLLTITPQEEIQGVKHVFQTQITKDTVDERLSSSMGMWKIEETFIDNNAQYLLDRLHNYYGGTAKAA